jgi:hypothetical protein
MSRPSGILRTHSFETGFLYATQYEMRGVRLAIKASRAASPNETAAHKDIQGTAARGAWRADLRRDGLAGVMIRIAISRAAFDAIASTMPLGSVAYEREVNANGSRYVWLAPNVVDRLAQMRGPGESYSDVIIRLAEA